MSAANNALQTAPLARGMGEGSGVTSSRAGNGSLQITQWRSDRPLRTEPRPTRIDDAPEVDVEFEPFGSEKRPEVQVMHDDAGWARATVLNVEAEFVTCEVNAAVLPWEFSLPRIMFPPNARYGAAVRVGVRDVNGYRTPVVEGVTVQAVHDPELEQLRAELEAL